MIEESFVRLRTHRNNVHRYRQLLKTMLTDAERQFIERRLTGRRVGHSVPGYPSKDIVSCGAGSRLSAELTTESIFEVALSRWNGFAGFNSDSWSIAAAP